MTGKAVLAASRTVDGARVPPFELVIVSYRSRPQVEGLLANLPGDLPICIVDNAGGVDGLVELVKSRRDARYVDGGGSGFARAANQGARTSQYEVVVFGNPDSRPSIGDYCELVRTVVADPCCAAASATMVSSGRGRRARDGRLGAFVAAGARARHRHSQDLSASGPVRPATSSTKLVPVDWDVRRLHGGAA